jgi:hypothetical protein
MPDVSTHPTAQALALFGHGKLSEAQPAGWPASTVVRVCVSRRNAIH